MISTIRNILDHGAEDDIRAVLRALDITVHDSASRDTMRETLMSLINSGRIKKRQVLDILPSPANIDVYLLHRTVRDKHRGKRITMREMADLVDVTPQTMRHWVNGDTPADPYRVAALRDKLKREWRWDL